jgi:hypothetical protein
MRRTVIFGLTAILIVFLGLVQQRASPAWFGYYHDDSLYWTAAKSLSQGDGYRMPSVPGEPPQTKYPVLFPWLLSWVWHFEPEFPANLAAAVWLVALAGAAFVGGSFRLLGQLGLGPRAALTLTAVCALHPVVVHLSGLLLSDVPFMALTVWSLVFAGLALERPADSPSPGLWGAALSLALLACLLRTIGVTILGGFAVAAVSRRSYRPAAGCLALAGLLALAVLGSGAGTSGLAAADAAALGAGRSGTGAQNTGAPNTGAVAVVAADSQALDGVGPESSPIQQKNVLASGYDQTMQFYTSYVGFWKLSVPDRETLLAQLTFNFRELLKQPSIEVFDLPASGFAGFGWQLAAIALSFAVVKGMVSLAAATRHAAFAVLGAYAVVVLLWNYTLMDRFFGWALPLFLAGAWFEIGRLARTTGEAFRQRQPLSERAVAALVMAFFAAITAYGGYRYLWVTPRALAAGLAERQQIEAQKQQAYQWIRHNTAPDDRFIASEDASLYLYTGRQALRPMAFSTAAFYRQSQPLLDADLARMGDTARRIGARYWLAADDDYHLESAQEFIARRTSELLQGKHEVFSSNDKDVRIYDLATVTAAGAGPRGED